MARYLLIESRDPFESNRPLPLAAHTLPERFEGGEQLWHG